MNESRMGEKRNELLADVAGFVARRLCGHGLSGAEAESIGNDVVDMLSDLWRGQTIYIPSDFLWRLGARDLAIYDAWNAGRQFDDLAREHKMTPRAVRLLINRVRAKLRRARDERQGDLLDPGQ